jgi:CBS domain-containing protein
MMQVHDAMARTISIGSPQDSIQRIAQLMKREEAGFIPISENERLVGVVTDRDIVIRGLAEGNGNVLETPAERIMSRNPATIEANASLEGAARLMGQLEVRRLPVVDNGRLVGVLSHGNLVQATRSNGAGDTATLGVTRGA